MKKARKAQPAMHHPSTGKTNTRRFVKGSDEAREFMSQLRDAKHHKRAAAIEKDKDDFWGDGGKDAKAYSWTEKGKATPLGATAAKRTAATAAKRTAAARNQFARHIADNSPEEDDAPVRGGAVRGRLVKGSQEAKDHMARLRAMRR